MEAILFVGIPGSGKSTYYARHFADTHLRLNRDMLRTNHRLEVLFHAALAVQQSLVLDNTHPTRDSRARWIAGAKAVGYTVVGYWFPIATEAAIARNAQRPCDARVPDAAILGCAAKMEAPLLTEGFDALHVIRDALTPGETT